MSTRPLCLLLLLLPEMAGAAEKATPGGQIASPLSWGNLVQMFLGLAVVIALVMGMAWLMRRMTGIQGGAQGALRILGGLSMGSREKVVLVQVGETQLLVGVAPGRVQTLHVLEENIEAPNAARGQASAGFARALHKAMNKGEQS